MESKANIVEQVQSSNNKKFSNDNPKSGGNIQKFKGICYNCGKTSHCVVDCRGPPKNKRKSCKGKKQGKKQGKKTGNQANITKVDIIAYGVDDINLSALVSEGNLVGNPKE